jgi:hypothetical protein
MESLDGVPVNVEVPRFLHLSSKKEQYAWLKQLGAQLLRTYVKLDKGKLLIRLNL